MARPALVKVLLAGAAISLPLKYVHAQSSAAGAIATAPSSRQETDPISSRATVEEVVVHANRTATGGGLIKAQQSEKAVSTVSQAYIHTQAALQNAYQYMQLTPGALVSTADPYGLSTQGSINVHGLGQDELGYVLEGMPLNDIGYYAAYPSQFIDSENIDEISLAQGTADLDSPVISAAGGLMSLTMLDPSLHSGGLASFSYGSYDTDREFIRLDSGLIGNTGVRMFASFSHTASDNWRGPGRTQRYHVDFKTVKEWGDGNRVTLAGTYHNGVTPLYIQPTLGDFKAYGTHENYDASFTPGDTEYIRLHTGTFRVLYLSAPSQLRLSSNLTFNATPYWQYGYGNGPYGTNLTEEGNYQGVDGPYTVNIPGYPANGGTVMANFQDLQYRAGVTSKLTFTTGPNSIIAGFWYDHSTESDTQSYSALNSQGNPYDLWADSNKGMLRLPDGTLLLGGKDRVRTDVYEPFIADVLRLFDNKLTLEVGFKEAWIQRHGRNEVPGPQDKAVIKNNVALPRAAARYEIDSHNMVFATVSTNFRTPSEATMFDAYYGGSVYSAANTNLKPEYSVSEDLGYRYTGHLFTASVSLFNFDFKNRQVSTLVGGSLINESINAGKQTTRGVDVEAGMRPWHHVSPYVSGEYLHSKDKDDLLVGDTYLPTAGKTAVRSPKFQAALGLTYDDGTFFGNFNVKYVDSQYATFMNDEKIPRYATANLSLGARLPSIGLKARPELKLNITNITNKKYLSSVANPTANANDTVARDGSVISGASPTYYLSGGRAALLTVTQAF